MIYQRREDAYALLLNAAAEPPICSCPRSRERMNDVNMQRVLLSPDSHVTLQQISLQMACDEESRLLKRAAASAHVRGADTVAAATPARCCCF